MTTNTGEINSHAVKSNKIAGWALFVSLLALAGSGASLYQQWMANKLTIANFRPTLDLRVTAFKIHDDSVDVAIGVNNVGTRAACLHSLTVMADSSGSLQYEIKNIEGNIIVPGSSRIYPMSMSRFTKMPGTDDMIDIVRTIKSSDSLGVSIRFSSEDYPEQVFTSNLVFPGICGTQ